MMDAVGGDPEDRPAFECHGAAGGQEVLEPARHLITTVSKQAVIGHADAHINGEEVHDNPGSEVLPGEKEQRSDGADVEEPHEDAGNPVDAAFLVLATHAEVLLDALIGLPDGGEAVNGLLWSGEGDYSPGGDPIFCLRRCGLDQNDSP